MPVDPQIMNEARSYIGRTSQAQGTLITRRDIRRFSIAVGDLNPLWRDDEYAKQAGYDGVIAPPLFYCNFNLPDEDLHQLEHSGLGGNMGVRFEVPVPGYPGAVTGGRTLEYGDPIRPGDTISSEEKVIDVYEKEGRSGPMIFIISQTTYTNQEDKVVLVERQTTIRTE